MFFDEENEFVTEYSVRDIGDNKIQLILGEAHENDQRVDRLTIEDAEQFAKLILAECKKARG